MNTTYVSWLLASLGTLGFGLSLALLIYIFLPAQKESRKVMQERAHKTVMQLLTSKGSITSPARRAQVKRLLNDLSKD